MTRRIRSFIRTDRDGQTLAIVAVMMVALLALLGLGIDLGMAYTARAEAQRVADSSALAGASAFLDHTHPVDAVSDAEARARDYAARNVVRNRPVDPDEDVVVQVLPNEEKVRVWVRRTGLPAWFSRLLGRTQLDVRAMAAARAMNAGSSHCVKPFAVPDRWEENSGDDKNGDGHWDFDNIVPCNGIECNANEVWGFDPDAGDVYRPVNQVGSEPAWSNPAEATSYGSTWRDGMGTLPKHGLDKDHGIRIPIKLQTARASDVPSWWFPWVLPGSSNKGVAALKDNIMNCVSLESIGGVGGEIELDAESKNGISSQPIWEAIKELIDLDPDLEWNDATQQPEYPEGSDKFGQDPSGSDRIITIALVHPGDVRQGKNYMRVVDLATLFLEDPRHPDVYNVQGPQGFKAPITGRLMTYGAGSLSPGNATGQLQKIIRLVE